MPGCVIPVFSMRKFDFSALAPNSEIEVVMAKTLCVEDWTELVALVRLHDKSPHSAPGGGSIDIIFEPTAPSCDDRPLDFVPARPAPPAAPDFTIAVDTDDPRPHLYRGALPFSPGALRVTVRARQPPTALATFAETISVDLVAKSKD